MAFCTGCGKELKAGAVFCSSCGANQKQEGANAAQSTKISEKTTGGAVLVLSTNKKEGFMKMTPCFIVFYEDELILAHLGKQRQKDEMEKYRLELKEQGKGFFKSAVAMITFWKDYGIKYYSMPKQLILEEETTNTNIAYSSIQKLYFKTITNSSTDLNYNTSSSTQGKIKLSTVSGKYKFTHNYYDSNKKIKKILTDLLGKKLKYRGNLLSISLGAGKDGIH
jgi:hypothetical protein